MRVILRVALLLLISALLIMLSESGYLDRFWSQVFHEVGFALLVAFLVWTLFELQISQEHEEEWTRRLERVTQNVFQAVLKKELPQSLIDEANNLVLDSRLVRESFSVSYTLRDEQAEISEGVPADCVLMAAVVSFSMRNISTTSQVVPISVGLPNPVHPSLKQMCRVASLTVTKGDIIVPFDLNAAEATFRQRLASDQSTSVPFQAGTVTLAPAETMEFRAEYVMAKEVEDTELLQTLYPCDGLTVTVTDLGPQGSRLVFGRSVHRRDIEARSSTLNPETKSLRIPDYLLPHQGVLIWWKRNPRAARPPQAARPALPGVP